jgi:hypothetical protein
MTDAPAVHIHTAFGPSLAEALILCSQRDEWGDDEGPQRAFVVGLTGLDEDGELGAEIRETLPSPVHRSWSSDNGTTYCSSNAGELWVHGTSGWTRERACEEPLQLEWIWGLSGSTPEEDELFVSDEQRLFVRRGGTWQALEVPGNIEMINGIHGLRGDQIYLATDAGLYLWDGHGLHGHPAPGGEALAIRVLSEDEMLLAADNALHRWTRAEGWVHIEGPDPTIALVEDGSDVFIGTIDGAVRLEGDHVRPELHSGFCNFVARLGEDLLVSGEAVLVRQRGLWRPVRLPTLARGATP